MFIDALYLLGVAQAKAMDVVTVGVAAHSDFLIPISSHQILVIN